MAEECRLKAQIERDEDRPRRYRWTIREGDETKSRSAHSYATRREAKVEAENALKRMVTLWRNSQPENKYSAKLPQQPVLG